MVCVFTQRCQFSISRNKAVKCYCGELHLSNKDELNVNFWFLSRILLVIFRTFVFTIYFNKFAFFVYGKSQNRMFQTGPLNFSSFWFDFFFVKFLNIIFLHYFFCMLLIQKWFNKKRWNSKVVWSSSLFMKRIFAWRINKSDNDDHHGEISADNGNKLGRLTYVVLLCLLLDVPTYKSNMVQNNSKGSFNGEKA